MVRKIHPGSDDYERIAQTMEQNPDWSYTKIAKHLGLNYAPVRTCMEEIRETLKSMATSEIITDKKVPKIDLDELFTHAQKGQEIAEKASGFQYIANITLPDRPFAIGFPADWHFGSAHTNHSELYENYKWWLSTPDLYIIAPGDVVDNFTSFKSIAPILSQVINPSLQRQAVAKMLTQLTAKGKLIAFMSGNHDSFEVAKLGESVIEALLADKVLILHQKAQVTVNVGEQKYNLGIVHDTKFNSYLSNLHGNRQERRNWFTTDFLDVIVSAHIHTPGFEQIIWQGQEAIHVRCGSYKAGDPFSRRYWSPGVLRVPAVVFDNKSHRITGFLNAEDAVRYMRSLEAEKELVAV